MGKTVKPAEKRTAKRAAAKRAAAKRAAAKRAAAKRAATKRAATKREAPPKSEEEIVAEAVMRFRKRAAPVTHSVFTPVYSAVPVAFGPRDGDNGEGGHDARTAASPLLGVRAFASSAHDPPQSPTLRLQLEPLCRGLSRRNRWLTRQAVGALEARVIGSHGVQNPNRSAHPNPSSSPSQPSQPSKPSPRPATGPVGPLTNLEQAAWASVTRTAVLTVRPCHVVRVLEGILVLLRASTRASVGHVCDRFRHLLAACRLVLGFPACGDVASAWLLAMRRGAGFMRATGDRDTSMPDRRAALAHTVSAAGILDVQDAAKRCSEQVLRRVERLTVLRGGAPLETMAKVRGVLRRSESLQKGIEDLAGCVAAQQNASVDAADAARRQLSRAKHSLRGRRRRIENFRDAQVSSLPAHRCFKGVLDPSLGLAALPDGKGEGILRDLVDVDGVPPGALRDAAETELARYPPTSSAAWYDGAAVYSAASPDDAIAQHNVFSQAVEDLLMCVRSCAESSRVSAATHGHGHGITAGATPTPELAAALLPVACLVASDETALSRLHADGAWHGVYQFADFACGAALRLPTETQVQSLPSRQSIAASLVKPVFACIRGVVAAGTVAERAAERAAGTVVERAGERAAEADRAAVRARLVVGECLDRGLFRREDVSMLLLSLAWGCATAPRDMVAGQDVGHGAGHGAEHSADPRVGREGEEQNKETKAVTAWLDTLRSPAPPVIQEMLARAPESSLPYATLCRMLRADTRVEAGLASARAFASASAAAWPLGVAHRIDLDATAFCYRQNALQGTVCGWPELDGSAEFRALWLAFRDAALLPLVALADRAGGEEAARIVLERSMSVVTLWSMTSETCGYSPWNYVSAPCRAAPAPRPPPKLMSRKRGKAGNPAGNPAAKPAAKPATTSLAAHAAAKTPFSAHSTLAQRLWHLYGRDAARHASDAAMSAVSGAGAAQGKGGGGTGQSGAAVSVARVVRVVAGRKRNRED